MATAEKVGTATCPLCRKPARVSLMKTKLVCLTCNSCNMQLFARSDRSDELVRALIVPDAKPAAEAKPAEAAPAPAVQQETAPAAAAAEPAPVRAEPARTRSPFAMFGG